MNIFRLACLAFGLSAVAPACQASVEISSNPTHNMNCTDGVCTPTAKNADLNAIDLANMLADGDVKVVTGSGAVTITVTQSFSWTSTHRLTLDANLNVSFRAPVVVAGQGAVTITYNDGGTGGDLLFFDGSKLDFWDSSSSLIIQGKHYALVKDIATLAKSDALGRLALANDYDASIDGTYSSSPVTMMFLGTLEGLGHVISNLSIAGTGGALFLQASGTLRDLGITNLSINSSSEGAALVARDNGATIIGCFASGTIVAGVAGGLVADIFAVGSSKLISRSHADVSITVPAYGVAGGLAGKYGAAVTNSYATGTITGGDHALLGGLVGEPVPSYISQSFASVAITGGTSSTVGGFVGSDGYGSQVTNSYSTGAVKVGPDSKIGGFLGQLTGTVEYSYSTGNVEGRHAGGFIGELDGGLSRNYWDLDTSGQRHCYSGGRCRPIDAKRLTTEEFLSALPVGFDPAIWGQSTSINNGYPYLLANPPPQ